MFLLRPDDIVYVEADGNYACMYFAGGTKECPVIPFRR